MTELEYIREIAKKDQQIAVLRTALSAERKFSKQVLNSINEKLTQKITEDELVQRINYLVKELEKQQSILKDTKTGEHAPAYKQVPVEAIAKDYITGSTWAQLEIKYNLSAYTMRERLKELGLYDQIKDRRREYIKKMKGGL